MKYTLLTAVALATVAIAAPAPEKDVSLGNLGLGGDSGNKAFIDGDFITFKLNLVTVLQALGFDKNTIEVPTPSKAKVKRGHHQGAQLVNILNGLLGDVQVNTNAIDNILDGVRTGGITRVDGTKHCVNLLQVITGLVDGVVGSLTGFSTIGGGDYNQQEVIGILDPLVSGVSTTVGNVVRTLGVGRGSVGSDSLTPVTSSLSNLLQCLLRIDPSLGSGLQDILRSILGGAGSGRGLLGGLVGDVVDPVKSLLSSINLEAEVEIGGKEEEEEEENSSGNGSSGSGNESPVYNVPT